MPLFAPLFAVLLAQTPAADTRRAAEAAQKAAEAAQKAADAQQAAAAAAADGIRRAAEAAEKAAEAAQKAAEAAQRSADAIGKAAQPAAPAAAAPPAAPAAAPAPPPPAWTGTVSVALISLTGNSSTLTFSSNGALERKSQEWIWGVKASAAYGQSTASGASESQTTALNAGVQARGDRRFSDQLSVYLMAGIDTDHLKSIESRPFGELGISMIWFDTKEGDLAKSSLKTDLGFRYGREYRFDYYNPDPNLRHQLPEVDVVAPRLGLAFRYAINKNVIFTEDVSALGNVVGTARLLFSSTSKLSARLTEKVSLGVGFVVTDDTVPAKDKVPADTALSIGLEIAI